MTQHLRRDLEQLEREFLAMGALVETAVNKAVVALGDRRVALAVEVEQGDPQIDAQEIRVASLCTRILALHHPVASDLRLVLACLKANTDLERIGDLAVNVAGRARDLGERPPLPPPAELGELADRTRSMVRASLDAFVNGDTALAESVIAADDAVDALDRRLAALLEERMQAEPETVTRALQVLSCSRQLERIADLATNLGEEVVFLVRGEVIRHARPE